MLADVTGIGDVADLWRPMWLGIQVFAGGWVVALVAFWRVTIIARKRAYGPGQGRRWVAPK